MQFIGRCRPIFSLDPRKRVPIEINPRVRTRLCDLLERPEFQGVGYSAFIGRAIEVAEAEIRAARANDPSYP